jgi:hypothetical protein
MPTGQTTKACVDCLNAVKKPDACLTKFQTDCQASADCVTFLTCLQGCAG